MRINVLSYLEETATRYPERIAVMDDRRSVSFSELVQQSKTLALILSNKINGSIRRPIAVFLEKSVSVVIADIGIVRIGCAYMNLDIHTPAARIDAILHQIDPLVIITDDRHVKLLPESWPKDKIYNLDQPEAVDEDVSKLPMYPKTIIDTDPLCIINTSGSTGTPKGVVLNHRSFIDFTEWSFDTMNFGDHEILGCLSPIVFDIYSYELMLMMGRGATMVLLAESYATFPVRLLQRMIEQKVTFIFWVPTIMVHIANMGLLDRLPLPDLRIVWFAGEVFPTKQFNIWREKLPQVTFVNLYGPIEITLDCTYYIVDRKLSDDEPIPIGYPCRNTDILILTDKNQMATPGEEGELCVRGTSLAMGYYNNPEKTAAAFVQNPLNTVYPELIYRTGDIACLNERGEIIFKGRKDTLVKHSGYRIELSEIEHTVVNRLNLVKNACAVYDHDRREIVLFYESGEDIPTSTWRSSLVEFLAKYMIPTVYRRVNEMPRNTNGKIDRLFLKDSLHK